MSFLKKMAKSPQRSVGIAPLSGSMTSRSGVGLASMQVAVPMGTSSSALVAAAPIAQDPSGGEPGRSPFSLNLGEYKLVFDDGRWTSRESGDRGRLWRGVGESRGRRGREGEIEARSCCC